jgi:predicted phosphodiesterase
MRYAIFSDIHGNFPALKAALADAENQGADMFLMLGDYGMMPWVNEVAETMRGLDRAVVIRGNGEGYLINLRGQNQNKWIHEQFKPLYWTYRTLKPENLEYLTSIPETAVISEKGENIHLSHSLKIFYRSPKIKPFHTSGFRAIMEKTPFSHEEYLSFARDELLSATDVIEEIHALPKGVYLFGHNHLQFHMEYEGRIFVNPGSCGVACDWNPTAAYTILERIDNGWDIIERRVQYDIDLTAEGLRRSSFAAEAPFWIKIIERQLITGKDYFGKFVSHIAETGRKLGHTGMPVSNDVWSVAVETWDVVEI